MMHNNYLNEFVKRIQPLDGYRVQVNFADGFVGQVDPPPLLNRGPLFAAWHDPEFFRGVKVSPAGIAVWSDELDLSPASLRAWCEAGRFMDYDETDSWIEEHGGAPQSVV